MTYSLSGGQTFSESIATTAVSIPITVDGVTTIQFQAQDYAGNVEAGRTLIVRIDKTPPTLTFGAAAPAANAAGWNNTNVSVAFTPNDALSGVASTSPNVSPLILTGEGSAVSGTVTVTDVAGNSATFTTTGFRIDKTAPMMTFGAISPLPNSAGWNNTNVSIMFTVADSLSGVATTNPASPLILTTEGATINGNVTVTDVAGNSATVTSPSVKIDKTPPVLTFGSTTPAPNAAGWNNTNVTIPFTATDAISGVATTSVLSPLVLSGEGTAVTGKVMATDRAGNSATFSTVSFKIDKTPPTLTVPSPLTVNATSPAGAVVTYSSSATDLLDPNPTVKCTPASRSTFPIGVTTVNCTATDAASNSTTKSFQITVKSALMQISDLIAKVQGLPINSGYKNNLVDKLNTAKTDLQANNVTGTCSALSDFVQDVQGQSGKKLTVAQATDLISDATRIKAVIGCR